MDAALARAGRGLPPIKDSVCTQWVRGMIRDGVNLVAVTAPATIVGHTALFGVNDQKCGFEYVDGKQGRELDMALDLSKLRTPVERASSTAAQTPYALGWHVPLARVSAADVG